MESPEERALKRQKIMEEGVSEQADVDFSRVRSKKNWTYATRTKYKTLSENDPSLAEHLIDYVNSFEFYEEDENGKKHPAPLPSLRKFFLRYSVSTQTFYKWLKDTDAEGRYLYPELIHAHNEFLALQQEFLVQHSLLKGYDSKMAIYMLEKQENNRMRDPPKREAGQISINFIERKQINEDGGN